MKPETERFLDDMVGAILQAGGHGVWSGYPQHKLQTLALAVDRRTMPQAPAPVYPVPPDYSELDDAALIHEAMARGYAVMKLPNPKD